MGKKKAHFLSVRIFRGGRPKPLPKTRRTRKYARKTGIPLLRTSVRLRNWSFPLNESIRSYAKQVRMIPHSIAKCKREKIWSLPILSVRTATPASNPPVNPIPSAPISSSFRLCFTTVQPYFPIFQPKQKPFTGRELHPISPSIGHHQPKNLPNQLLGIAE